MKTNAVHDQGSSTSFLSKEMASKLQLQGAIVPMTLKTFGPDQNFKEVVEVRLRIFDSNKKDLGFIHARVMPHFADITAVDWSNKQGNYPHLHGIEVPKPFAEGACDLLLGNNCARLIAPSRVEFVNENDSPVAHRTQLGWSVAGPSGSCKSSSPWSEDALCALKDSMWNKVKARVGERL